jgi:hypothetical protein
MIGSKDTLAIRRREVAAKVIDGEAILINLSTGQYYSMGDVGGRVWSLIEQNCNSEGIATAIAAEYDVPAATAAADVAELVADLAAENLIEPNRAVCGATPVARSSSKAAYRKPELSKFSDMAEIFAMDPPLPGLAQ